MTEITALNPPPLPAEPGAKQPSLREIVEIEKRARLTAATEAFTKFYNAWSEEHGTVLAPVVTLRAGKVDANVEVVIKD